jgi:hypothetical protein
VLLLVLVVSSPVVAQSSRGGDGPRDVVEPDDVFRRVEVLMEGGLTLPQGNLGAEFLSEEGALGAENGFMLGLRVRFYLSPRFSLAPAFSYTEYGDYDGLDVNGDSFTILARVLRYGLDALYMTPGRRNSLRPFAGVGVAVVRNKYREEFAADELVYAAGLNDLAWSAQLGLRWRDWELSVDYEVNRFSTARFLPAAREVDYDWSRVMIRLAYALPRI